MATQAPPGWHNARHSAERRADAPVCAGSPRVFQHRSGTPPLSGCNCLDAQEKEPLGWGPSRAPIHTQGVGRSLDEVEADRGDLHGGRLLLHRGVHRRPRAWHSDAAEQGPSTPSGQDQIPFGAPLAHQG
jgi:hypothetical protein